MRTWPVPSILPFDGQVGRNERFLGLGVDGAARHGGDGGRIHRRRRLTERRRIRGEGGRILFGRGVLVENDMALFPLA
jgi:hypothetical protein